MSAPAPVVPESAATEAEHTSEVFGNRFLLVAVAAQRVLQIRSGARPRLAAGIHKPCFVAIAEVAAGSVPFFAS